MASWWDRPAVCATLTCFLGLVPAAEALDGGDAVALLLGIAVCTVGVCAGLGWYSRKRNGQS
ncbi:small integral membrane protein 30-like [Callorhinchus milii]|uniref:small integral membrane protein 30-like n=1 Tax=Callorhinchus milii TaxID=7868 RepID=UPI001C3F6C32|nr:small integral membrane protein 30-like [Callorhinchus milii]